MSKPGKAGWQHGWQRGLRNQGANVSSSNQHLWREMRPRQLPHEPGQLVLILPISAAPSHLLYGAIYAFYRQINTGKGQGPFSFSTAVRYVWYPHMQCIWTAADVILLAGGLQVKRLVCRYENGASDLKPLTTLAGIWIQFRFLFLWDNPLALMTKGL